nr:hypothetical protein Cduv_376 [Cedratvirus duvanny]
MQSVYLTIFSFSGGYNFRNRQVCSEFRQMVPRVLRLCYLDTLYRDDSIRLDQLGRKIIKKSIKLGCVNILEKHKHEVPKDIFYLAAYYQNIDSLNWAKDNGYKFHRRICGAAAMKGSFVLLRWIKDNGYGWDEDTCGAAAEGGQLETLKWLRVKGWFRFAKFYVKLSFT